MKGWKFVKPTKIEEQELINKNTQDSSMLAKVKITKALVTLSDVLHYSSELDSENVVLGSYGIGIVSETGVNLFGIEKGKHVYIEPTQPCFNCYNCKNGTTAKCSDLQIAGDNMDGFLRDFITVEENRLFTLPESVSDLQALFIGHISLALTVVDKLDIQKGDYVAIIGANDFGNILAQLLIYYQAVPILLTNDYEDMQIAKDSGIYYVLGPEDNWQKEVMQITGGRMTETVVYIDDCNIPANKSFSLASFNAKIAFTGSYYKLNPISFATAIKKQLDIYCINNGYGNTAASINLIANKAINLSHLKLDSAKYDDMPEVFEEMNAKLEKEGKIYETVVDLI